MIPWRSCAPSPGLAAASASSRPPRAWRPTEQLDLLRQEGCTQVQGYLFSKPRPAADVEQMLFDGQAREVA